MLCHFLRQQRGRQSRLARHLYTSRQSLSRWLHTPCAVTPPWAALAANVWLHRQISADQRNTLRSLACPPGQRQPKRRTNTTIQQSCLSI